MSSQDLLILVCWLWWGVSWVDGQCSWADQGECRSVRNGGLYPGMRNARWGAILSGACRHAFFLSLDLCQLYDWCRSKVIHRQLMGLQRGKRKHFFLASPKPDWHPPTKGYSATSFGVSVCYSKGEDRIEL